MNDFVQYLFYLLRRGIFFAVPVILLCGAGLAAAWWAARKRGRTFPWKQAVILLLLIGWLLLTVFVTILRSQPGYREWNLHLFLAWREAWNRFALREWLNVLLNIALFIPLGVLLPLLARPFRRWYVMLPAGFGTSLAIELAQLATARGMFDVDDLFTNTLGAMVGWSVTLLIWTALERKTGWGRGCLAYLIIPAGLALVVAGIFLCYACKPYGNLPDAPARTAELKDVQWELAFTPADTPAAAQVYEVGRLDRAASEQFAADFAQNAGFTIEDTNYYDDNTLFANHSTGDFLWLNHLDGTWEYDLGRETTPVFDVPAEEISSHDLLAALDGLGIAVPKGVEFTVQASGGSGFYTADAAVELGLEAGETLYYGSVRCDLREEDGKTQLNTIHYGIVTLTPCGEEPIRTPVQAVQALYEGRSFQGALLEYYHADQICVRSCTLDWKVDTKGFYQPVYRLELQSQELGTLTDYVAALQ